MKCIKVISILFSLLAVSCLRDPEVERNEPDAPTVSCDESSKTRVSFTVSGHVNKIIPNAIYGLIIESEDGAQQEKTFKEQDLSSDNTFLWKVDGLSPGSPYLIKSYISNDYGGRKYSESILVSTPKTSIATLSSVTFDKGSGLLRATIIDDGGRGLEDYGFLYGPSPDIKELKKEKRYSGVLNGIEISLPIGGLKVERPSNFIAYVEDKEGHLAYSPNCLPLALIDIYNLEIVPDNGDATIKIGSSIKMIPVVTPTVELPFVWSSDNETVATVDKEGVVTGLSEGSSTIKASCGKLEATHTIVVESIPVASVSLDPATVSLIEGQSTQLIATVLPENATNQTVSWSSSNESVATVDQHGLVQAMSVGSAYITATADEQSAACQVTVSKLVVPVTSVSLSQPFLTLEEGQSATLIATVLPENATDKTVTWSSSNTAIASVSQDGLVSAIAPGSATITAKAGDITATCLVSISAAVIPVTSVSLSQPFLTLEEGQSATLIATVLPENATDKTVTWSSSNTAIASVSQDGLVSAIAPGSATITAKAGDITATCLVSISAAVIPVTSVSLNYYTLALEEGQTATLVATVSPDNATDKTVTWSSSNSAIASVSQDGLVSAITSGSATITARAGDITATCLVSISAAVIPVTSVSLNYGTLALEEGQTATLIATVLPENATDKTVNWSSSNSSVASVSQDGLVSALSSGSATITARAGDRTASCQVTVSEVLVAVASISLNRTTLSLQVGQTTTLTATVSPENATDKTVIWSSSNEAVVSVSQSGLISAIVVGSSTIVASCGGIEASCNVEVTSNDPVPVVRITFSELEREVYVGEIFTLSATITPSNASNPQLEWTSSNTTIATVDSEGKITPVGVGECIIKATSISGISASFTCKVVSEAPVFADTRFKNYVYSNFDVNNDNFLSKNEVENVTTIACGSNSIFSLEGIGFFVNLKRLSCPNNYLSFLDLSENAKLEDLVCYGNRLTNLDLSKNPYLSYVQCYNNQLVSLILGINPRLKELRCQYNQLTDLDINDVPGLIYLDCQHNELTDLDISYNNLLSNLNCNVNQLSNLILGHNSNLSQLDCYYNQLTYLDISHLPSIERINCGYNQLMTLDISQNSILHTLLCSNNQLSEIIISNNPNLTTLDCSKNLITNLDVSHNGNLDYLNINGNLFTSFDFNGCANLRGFNCSSNLIESLDLSSCPNLTGLNCVSNKLTNLDLKQNIYLEQVLCYGNPITDIWLRIGQTIENFKYPETATLHYE